MSIQPPRTEHGLEEKNQVRVTDGFLFTSRVIVFTHFERVTELICKRLLFYILRKNKDLTRFLVHHNIWKQEKSVPRLLKYLFIIEIPDIRIQCKGKAYLMYNLLENLVKSSFGYL